MKIRKIINGLHYDTTKAEVVCEVKVKAGKGLLDLDIALCATPRSRSFFIAGTGGLLSVLVKRVATFTWTAGENNLLPLDKSAAEQIARAYASKAKYEKYFGESSL